MSGEVGIIISNFDKSFLKITSITEKRSMLSFSVIFHSKHEKSLLANYIFCSIDQLKE